MEHSETLAALGEALAAAQAEIGHAPKTASGQARGGRYHYATLADVIDAAKPALTKHGLAVLQPVEYGADGLIFIRTMLLHSSGEWVSAAYAMPVGPDASPQQIGSAITYARRYGLSSFLGIASDDDDGAAASEAPRQRAGVPLERADRPAPAPANGNGKPAPAAADTCPHCHAPAGKPHAAKCPTREAAEVA